MRHALVRLYLMELDGAFVLGGIDGSSIGQENLVLSFSSDFL